MLRTNIFWHKHLALMMICGLTLACGNVVNAQDDDSGDKDAGLVQEARQALADEDFDEAAELLAKAVKLNPKNALAWQLHGFALHAAGKLDEAIKSHEKAGGFDSTEGIALYNLGCAYSLKKMPKKSMDYLEKAIKAGFAQAQYFDNDSDLENVRGKKRFKKLLAMVKGEVVDEPSADEKSDEKKKPKKFNPKALVGQWKITSGTRSGNEIGEDRLPPLVKITAKEITIAAGDDPFVFSYTVDAKKSPVTIDLNIEAGPAPEGKAVGILKMKNKKLMLCYDPMGAKRPTKFETNEEDGCFYFELERIKKNAKKDKKAKAEKADEASADEADSDDSEEEGDDDDDDDLR